MNGYNHEHGNWMLCLDDAMTLNERANRVADELERDAAKLREATADHGIERFVLVGSLRCGHARHIKTHLSVCPESPRPDRRRTARSEQ